MAVRCESGLEQVTLYPKADREVLEFAQKWRGNKFTWAPRLQSNVERRDLIREWLSKTPMILDWFVSPDAYHAPRTYPKFLKEAFGQVPPPRPYELACMKWGKIERRKFFAKGIYYLRAYCFGFTLPQIARMTGEPIGFIKTEMFDDLKSLCEEPGFALWCLNISWKKVRWPINVDIGMLNKIKLQQELAGGPQFIRPSNMQILLASTNFWRFVRQGRLEKRGGLRLRLHKNWLGTYSHRRTSCRPVKLQGRAVRLVRDPGKARNTEAG
tara:strand:- start:2383 stop:3189 length:807 start_codon:yes stop_codon:yes gene_type:complete